MRKIFIIALREYKAAVKTKSFIFSLILVPVLMGGSIVISLLTQNKVDTTDRRFVVIDHSGLFKDALNECTTYHNQSEIFKPGSKEKIKPVYYIDFLQVDTAEPIRQKLMLSEKIESKELAGFLEIGSGVLYPGTKNSWVRYYSESAFLDETRDWFGNCINNHLRMMRISELGLPADSVKDLFSWTNIESLGLFKVDEGTGNIKEAQKSNAFQSILIPYVLVMLMFMMAIMGSVPLLTAVMEEKMERIAEVLLATITPFQFMAGKILGGTCVSLTTAVIYIAGGVITANQMGFGNLISYDIFPWFFIYLVLFLVMTGAIMTALGSACNDNKDAQNVSFPGMIPIIIPLFVIMPVLRSPMGTMATWLSLFPPFTPMLMIVRQASPVTIPAWQPYIGLAGVVIFTILLVWIASRIFRTGILLQGQKPGLANLIRYALKR